jgi:hypothetical protein
LRSLPSPPRRRRAATRWLPQPRWPHAQRASPCYCCSSSRARGSCGRCAPGSPRSRAGLAVALALTLIWLVSPIGLESSDAERAALALVAFGLITVATRRATLLQVVGIVLVENALALAALELPGASSLVIEVGVALDLTLVALVAAVFHERIFAEFGAGDTAALRTLRD